MPADPHRRPTPAEPEAARTYATAPAGRRLPRAERREQILAAATRAFARTGFTATSLDDIAAEAGISRVILYRHFDSKTDLYRAVLDRAQARLQAAVGTSDFNFASVDALVSAAADDPDGFKLLFRHAAREPEFRREMDEFQAGVVAIALRQIAREIPDPAWARWAAQLAPAVTIEAVMAWLDAGRPDRSQVTARIRQAIGGVIRAAQPR